MADSSLWTAEELKENLRKAIWNAWNWNNNITGHGMCLDDGKWHGVTSEIVNMDFSSEPVREALQTGLEKREGVTLVVGPGGCGKSMIYKAIAHATPRCMCLAPTGIAAMNLAAKGWADPDIYTPAPRTIHSALNLPARDFYEPEDYKKLASLLSNGKWSYRLDDFYREDSGRPYELILIDEVSMISPNLLDLILYTTGKLDIPVIMFGDPMQLRPVEVSPKKDAVTAAEAACYTGWNFFNSYVWTYLQGTGAAHTIILDSVYRQSDPGFKSLLNRARVNEMTEGDWEMLEKKVTDTPDPDALILCKRNSDAEKINTAKAGKAGLEFVLDPDIAKEYKADFIRAVRQRYRVTEGSMSKRDRSIISCLNWCKPFNTTTPNAADVFGAEEDKSYNNSMSKVSREYAGFCPTITLYGGDRIMITKNIITEELVAEPNGWKASEKYTRVANGEMGWYLGYVNPERVDSHPMTQNFSFEYDECAPLLVLMDSGKFILLYMTCFTVETRTSGGTYAVSGQCAQYPLKLAYALTYHKAQGLTLDKVHMILDGDGPNAWRVPGLAYLGMSRCRSYEGLTIQGMSRNEFLVDKASKNYVKHLSGELYDNNEYKKTDVAYYGFFDGKLGRRICEDIPQLPLWDNNLNWLSDYADRARANVKKFSSYLKEWNKKIAAEGYKGVCRIVEVSEFGDLSVKLGAIDEKTNVTLRSLAYPSLKYDRAVEIFTNDFDLEKYGKEKIMIALENCKGKSDEDGNIQINYIYTAIRDILIEIGADGQKRYTNPIFSLHITDLYYYLYGKVFEDLNAKTNGQVRESFKGFGGFIDILNAATNKAEALLEAVHIGTEGKSFEQFRAEVAANWES